MKVFLIRHAESKANIDNDIYNSTPNPEIELTEKGVLQAQQLAKRLKKRLERENGSISILSSPYKRALQTANEISEALQQKVETNELLIEREFGEALGYATVVEYVANRPKQLSLYYKTGDLYYKPPQGESKLDVIKRGIILKKEIEDIDSEIIIIVSHQATLKLFHNHVLRLLSLEEKDWSNCCCRVYNVVDKHWTFRSFDLV